MLKARLAARPSRAPLSPSREQWEIPVGCGVEGPTAIRLLCG